MRRHWKTWLGFGLCAALLLAAVGRVSLTALRLETDQWTAGLNADHEEKVRLALWRIDTALGTVLLEEGTRPTAAYEGANPLPSPGTPAPPPRAGGSSVLLHFQLDPAGRLSSSREPDPAPGGAPDPGRTQALARDLEGRLAAPVAGTGGIAGRAIVQRAARSGALPGPGTTMAQAESRPAPVPEPGSAGPLRLLPPGDERSQHQRNTLEQRARQNLTLQSQAALFNNYTAAPPPPASAQLPSAAPPGVGLPRPVWLGDALLLVREVRFGDILRVQGSWLDWPGLRGTLLAGVNDLLPHAALEPIPPSGPADDPLALATLPVRLVPSPAPRVPIPRWTPIRISLATAWGAILAAMLAVALLLQGAISLAERRTAFVSSVTHELRSPLTTFRLYSEMLAEGMVPDANTRQTYLDTLCTESNRLSHLVENVLAFAGLERGSANRRLEVLALGDLVERAQPRLHQRTRQAGLALRLAPDADARARLVRADASAVEQILFNLVDNACKYAAPASPERFLDLETGVAGRFALIRIRDHGPGIVPTAARRLFRPFGKSAQEAALSAPGVGLGLALARRLSRSLGGDLRHEPAPGRGAAFILLLPLADRPG